VRGGEKSALSRLFGADASTDDGLRRLQALIACLTRSVLLVIVTVGAVVWVVQGDEMRQWIIRAAAAIAGGGGWLVVIKLYRWFSSRRRARASLARGSGSRENNQLNDQPS
jgi:hypothetical protein